MHDSDLKTSYLFHYISDSQPRVRESPWLSPQAPGQASLL